MKNNEKLKKHHFWILAGIAPLLTVLAVVFILSEVGGAIEKEVAETEAKLTAAKGTQPKGTQAIDDFKKQKEKLEKQKLDLWKINYDKQKDQFTWPGNNGYLKELEAKYQKFGEPIRTNRDEFNTFKSSEIYERAYDDAANSIRPTTFATGNWRTGANGGPVFRYVSAWGDRYPTDKQIWLALEDLWVQRALLQPVNAVNEGATKFTPLPEPKGAKPNPLKRSFENRIWKLDLEVPDAGPNARKVIEAKLTNKTDRLQVLGTGGIMRLRVKLSDNGEPIDYVIQENFIRPGGTLLLKQEFPQDDAERTAAKKKGMLFEVKVNPAPTSQGIPVGTDVQKIVEVTQVLDARTVPVRQVLDIELGFKDCRHAAAQLKAPEWYPAEAPAAGSPAPGEGGLGGGKGGGLPPLGSPDGGFPGPGGAAGGAVGGRGKAKFGPPTVVLDANRERYIEVSKQVRRMPVALVLLVDQLFMQDALVAYANSPLRFQVTQTHWKRFRGTLNATGGGFLPGGLTPPGGSGDGDTGSPDGVLNLPPGPMGAGAGGILPPRGGAPGSDFGTPDSGPAGSTGGPSMPSFPGAGGFPGFGGFGGFGSSSTAPVSEAQLTSGLVELTIYGIVTLYEKYDDKPADGTAPAATPPTTTPAPGTTPTSTTPPAPMTTPPAAPGTATPPTPAPKDGTNNTTTAPPPAGGAATSPAPPGGAAAPPPAPAGGTAPTPKK